MVKTLRKSSLVKIWLTALCLTGALFTLTAQAAGPARFVEGVHYAKLPTPATTEDASKVEVVEVFSYACIHCYNFDTTVEQWHKAQPDYVQFKRVPAVFSKSWRLLAQAYYAAEALEVSDKTHTPLFEAIHKDRKDIRDPKLMADVFAAAANVDESALSAAFDSFGVRSKVAQAESVVGGRYQVNAVPTMVVNGKYRVEAKMAGSNPMMLQVVEYLVELERSEAAEAAEAEAAE